MKILQLNVWTGRIKGALLRFLRENDFDIICMQEAVWGGRQKELENFFATTDQIIEASGLTNNYRSSNWGMKIFSEDNIIEQGNIVLCKEKALEEKTEIIHNTYGLIKSAQDFKEHVYTLQILKLKNGINLINHHGYWEPTPLGSETTVMTMKRIASILKELKGPIVMCGDLNITHESPAMRELDFLRDLTHESNVKTTLTGLSFDGAVACDHILVSKDLRVKSFKVFDALVSDHKPLVIEI